MNHWLNARQGLVNMRADPSTQQPPVGILTQRGIPTRYHGTYEEQGHIWENHVTKERSFWVRRDLVEHASLAPVKLLVDHVSQNSASARLSRNDCGPASLAMLLAYEGVSVTVDDLTRATGVSGHRFTTFADNMRAARRYGYRSVHERMTLSRLIWRLEAGRPVMALVYYDVLQPEQRYGHFLVVHGVTHDSVLVQDPLRAPGDTYPLAQFADALAYKGGAGNMPFQGLYLIEQ